MSSATVSYLIFFLGRFHLLPFSKETIFLVLLLILVIDLFFLKKSGNKREFIDILKNNWQNFLGEEVIFFAALLFWSFLRGFQPDIEGLEKFMDFGFVNSILRSSWFPPLDMWFAGEPINYYYFGHLQTAVLTKLSGLDSAITYNLMIATIFALTFSGGFSLTSNLIAAFKKKNLKLIIVGGLIAALLLTLGGNLHTVVFVLKKGKDRYWYPDATRFIGYYPNNPNDKTIHEFPCYSFVVADLHGHMNDIPHVLLFGAVLLILGMEIKSSRKKDYQAGFHFLPLLGSLLAIMYMTNAWDLPIYGVLLVLFLFLIRFLERNSYSLKNLMKILPTVVFQGLVVLAVAILVSLPFSLSFTPIGEGIDFVRAHSLWWQLLILWGFFWFVASGLVVFVLKKIRRKEKLLIPDILVLSAVIWATILIIIPEIIYLKDIYIPEYHRANTMFKLVYQSFIIYSFSAGYILIRLREALRFKLTRIIYSWLFFLGFSAQMIYPYFAIKGYYGSLKDYQGIEGMNFLKKTYPDNYQAVLWLKREIVGQPVVLEAVGDSYTHYNHVSAMTGLPTIEGWLVHEWLWRGGYDRPGARAAEVEVIYQGEDDLYAQQLIKKYGVKYIFLGPLEREKYPNLREERLADWGQVVFSSGETKIYRLSLPGV